MNSEVNMTLEEKLKCSLTYDPETGKIFWRYRFGGRETARTSQGGGYLQGDFFGIRPSAHRLAWFLYYGVWPKDQIDHINGVRHDNRISNLRDVTQFENMKNAKRYKSNKSGVPGVFLEKNRKVWRSEIRVNNKIVRLGRFVCLGQAIKTRREAEKVYGFHENHGRR